MRVGGVWSEIIDGAFLVDAGYSDEVSVGDEVGSQYKTLTTSNMPSHNHTFTGTSATHTHTTAIHLSGDEATGYGLEAGSVSFGDRCVVGGSTMSTSSSGSHTHTVTASGTVGSTSVAPSGTVGSTENGTEFEITPKAIVVKRWRRVS